MQTMLQIKWPALYIVHTTYKKNYDVVHIIEAVSVSSLCTQLLLCLFQTKHSSVQTAARDSQLPMISFSSGAAILNTDLVGSFNLGCEGWMMEEFFMLIFSEISSFFQH